MGSKAASQPQTRRAPQPSFKLPAATAADNVGCEPPQPKRFQGLPENLEALFCWRDPAVFQQNRRGAVIARVRPVPGRADCDAPGKHSPFRLCESGAGSLTGKCEYSAPRTSNVRPANAHSLSRDWRGTRTATTPTTVAVPRNSSMKARAIYRTRSDRSHELFGSRTL